MARQRIDGTKVQVLVPDGDLDEIERRGMNRSEFIRSAISEKLHGCAHSLAPKTEKPVREKPQPAKRKPVPFGGDLKPDAAVLLSALRGKRMTSRDAEKSMGWLGLRYPNAEKQLIQAGLVSIDGGVLVAADASGASATGE